MSVSERLRVPAGTARTASLQPHHRLWDGDEAKRVRESRDGRALGDDHHAALKSPAPGQGEKGSC